MANFFLKSIVLSSLVVASIGRSAYAGNINAPGSRHMIELSFLVGELDTGFPEQEFTEDETKHYRLSYDYQFDGGLYLGGGYVDGESGELSPIDVLFGNDELVYDAVYVKGGYRHFWFHRHAIYTELSVLSYESKFTLNAEPAISDDGTGFGFAIGWQYQMDNGIGFKVGLDSIQLNSNTDIRSASAGISYSF